MKTRWSKRALRSFEDAFDYLDQRNPDAAQKLRIETEEVERRLGMFPKIGRPAGISDFRLIGLSKFPDLIF